MEKLLYHPIEPYTNHLNNLPCPLDPQLLLLDPPHKHPPPATIKAPSDIPTPSLPTLCPTHPLKSNYPSFPSLHPPPPPIPLQAPDLTT